MPYGQHVHEVEHSSLTPVILSATGGLAHEATIFHKCLASLLSCKQGDEYLVVLILLRCCLGFCCFDLPFNVFMEHILLLVSSLDSVTNGVRVPPVLRFLALSFPWPFVLVVQHGIFLCWGWLARATHLAWEKKVD